MKTDTQTLRLDQIRTDGGTQPRVAIDEQVVADYAGLYRDSVNLPPVTVFFDGATYWLADGFHRYWATKRIERESVLANIHQGTQRDAILYSVGANADHGLRRTNADKRKAVLTMLEDEEWCKWTDREIARRCGVTHPSVARQRVSLEKFTSENPSSPAQSSSEKAPATPRTYRTKHGTVATMKTRNIGQTKKPRSGKSARIAKGAFQPRQLHGEDGPVPMRSVKLPLNNPEQAARSMFSLFDAEWMQRMATEVLRRIQTTHTTEGNQS